jgi:hypothetical protein
VYPLQAGNPYGMKMDRQKKASRPSPWWRLRVIVLSLVSLFMFYGLSYLGYRAYCSHSGDDQCLTICAASLPKKCAY